MRRCEPFTVRVLAFIVSDVARTAIPRIVSIPAIFQAGAIERVFGLLFYADCVHCLLFFAVLFV